MDVIPPSSLYEVYPSSGATKHEFQLDLSDMPTSLIHIKEVKQMMTLKTSIERWRGCFEHARQAAELLQWSTIFIVF